MKDYLKEARGILDGVCEELKYVNIAGDIRETVDSLYAINMLADAGIRGNNPTMMKYYLVACRCIAACALDAEDENEHFVRRITKSVKEVSKNLEADKARKPTEEELRDLFHDHSGDQRQGEGKPPYKAMNA